MNECINEKLGKLEILTQSLNELAISPEDYLNLDKINKEIITSKDFSTAVNTYIKTMYKSALLMISTLIYIKQHRSIKLNLFPNYYETAQCICVILKSIYMNDKITNNLFYIPAIDVFVNIILKLPDIISDCGNEFNFNKNEYFKSLFREILKNDLFDKFNFIEKTSLLKLNKFIILAMSINDVNILCSFEESIYYEDFLAALFNIDAVSVENKIAIERIYENLKVDTLTFDIENFGRKIYGFIKKNVNILCNVLFSGNKNLLEFFINAIIDNFKSNFNRFDEFMFYSVFISLYIYLESQDININDKIIQEVLSIQGYILSKLANKTMKKINVLFSEFLKDFLSKKIKDFKFDKELRDEEHTDLSCEDKAILDFKTIHDKLKENKYFLSEYRVIFEKYFNLVIMTKTGNKVKPKAEKKTKFKSIKFQKKYGVYEKEDKLLEFPDTQKKGEEEIKLKIPVNNKFSFLKIKLDKEDDISDIQQLNKPAYIKDCILGITSEYPERQKLSLEALPDIIISDPLDLDYHLESLSETLLKSTNNFEMENFDELIEKSLIKLVIHSSTKMTQILCKRFFLEECSIKQKYQILTVIEKASEELSEYYSENYKKPYQNKLLTYFEFIVFPLLHYLKNKDIQKMLKIKEFDFLLGKFIMVISKLIKFSENHPFIYKALFESFDLFKAMSLIKETSLYILEALIYYANIISRFLAGGTFLEIYPEFAANFRFILDFLNTNLDGTDNEAIRIKLLQTINIYITEIEKIKESFNLNTINKSLLL
jgi:hypothetical protein